MTGPDAARCQPHILLMGVSGTGKTAVGAELAAVIGAVFLDADDLHPAANVRKMAAGEALGDADRGPWLDAVGRELAIATACGRILVVACSALKRSYRDRLRRAAPGLRIVWLTGATALIRERLTARTGHFMPASLLDSQFATLEPPTADEDPLVVDVSPSVEEVSASIAARLGGDHRG
jgi:gluconokinase